MNENNLNSESSKQSEWDGRQGVARRLDEVLIKANECYRNNDLISYKKELDRFWMEISSKLAPNELANVLNNFKIIEKEIISIHHSRKEIKKAGIKTRLRYLLLAWEIKLREYADKHNLLTPTAKSGWEAAGSHET